MDERELVTTFVGVVIGCFLGIRGALWWDQFRWPRFRITFDKKEVGIILLVLLGGCFTPTEPNKVCKAYPIVWDKPGAPFDSVTICTKP